jgi:hypothetical protein
MDYRVRFGIQGVPAQLWLRSTAQEILGSSCALLSMAPKIKSKASLKKFFVTVACLHPDLIPIEKVMWAPIPFDARHPQPRFRYRAVIDILEAVVVSPKSQRKGFDSLALLVVWSLWKERNLRVHERVALQSVLLAPHILEEARRWTQAGFVGIGSLSHRILQF